MYGNGNNNYQAGGDINISSSGLKNCAGTIVTGDQLIDGCTGIVISNAHVIIDGKKILIPRKVKKKNSSNVTTINNKVYINGYEYIQKTNEWKKTFKSLFYLLF